VFEDEATLIQHQKARHFKCTFCPKRFPSTLSLVTHVQGVHKEALERVPNALPNRDAIDLLIFGMNGVTEEAIRAQTKIQLGEGEDEAVEDEEEQDTQIAAPPPLLVPNLHIPTPSIAPTPSAPPPVSDAKLIFTLHPNSMVSNLYIHLYISSNSSLFSRRNYEPDFQGTGSTLNKLSRTRVGTNLITYVWNNNLTKSKSAGRKVCLNIHKHLLQLIKFEKG
jgi:hypothetical protein